MVLSATAFIFPIINCMISASRSEDLFLKNYDVIFMDTTEGITYPGLKYNFSLRDEFQPTYSSYQALVFFNIPYVKPIKPGKQFSTSEKLGRKEYKKLVLEREYKKFGHFCPQYEDSINYEKRMSMDLNCLNLNVFALPAKKNKLYPVYVLFHGGKLVHGSSLDLGVDGIVQNIVKEGIIVVTPNYRIGLWGFYNFKGESEGHSTRGFYDKLDALKWVQNNIKDFGGDNRRVTVGGYSAGACAVAVLTLAALANPEYRFFNNVILHSGFSNTCIAGGVFSQNYQEKLLQRLDCTLEEHENCIKNKTTEQILSATRDAAYFGIQYDAPDGIFKTRKEMLDDATKATTTKRPLNILMGTVLHEFVNFDGLIRNLTSKSYGRDYMREAFDRLVLVGTSTKNIILLILDKKDAEINVLHEKMMSILEKLLDIYFMSLDEEEFDEVGNFRMFKDYWMTTSMVNEARFFTRAGHKVTLYKFVHIGPLPSKYKQATPLKERVVPHGTDVFYAYMPRNNWQPMLDMPAKIIESERAVSKNLAKELSQFIQTGTTATPSATFDFQKLNYLLIDNKTVAKSDKPIMDLKTLELWQELVDTIQNIYRLDATLV